LSCGLLETLKFSVLELQEHLDTYNGKREAAEQVGAFITLSAVAIIVFRAELGLLLGLMLMMSLARRRLGLSELICCAVPAGLLALGRETHTHTHTQLILVYL